MKIKFIITDKKKNRSRTIFRIPVLMAGLWLIAQSFAPATVTFKRIKVVVYEPPAKWYEVAVKNTAEGAEVTIFQHVLRTNVTAYSSTRGQTDSSPFITAANTRVRHGIVACNFLEFGTNILIPEKFGNKIFTVEDRMSKKEKYRYFVDIWFSKWREAKKFGKNELEIIVLPD